MTYDTVEYNCNGTIQGRNIEFLELHVINRQLY